MVGSGSGSGSRCDTSSSNPNSIDLVFKPRQQYPQQTHAQVTPCIKNLAGEPFNAEDHHNAASSIAVSRTWSAGSAAGTLADPRRSKYTIISPPVLYRNAGGTSSAGASSTTQGSKPRLWSAPELNVNASRKSRRRQRTTVDLGITAEVSKGKVNNFPPLTRGRHGRHQRKRGRAAIEGEGEGHPCDVEENPGGGNGKGDGNNGACGSCGEPPTLRGRACGHVFCYWDVHRDCRVWAHKSSADGFVQGVEAVGKEEEHNCRTCPRCSRTTTWDPIQIV